MLNGFLFPKIDEVHLNFSSKPVQSRSNFNQFGMSDKEVIKIAAGFA